MLGDLGDLGADSTHLVNGRRCRLIFVFSAEGDGQSAHGSVAEGDGVRTDRGVEWRLLVLLHLRLQRGLLDGDHHGRLRACAVEGRGCEAVAMALEGALEHPAAGGLGAHERVCRLHRVKLCRVGALGLHQQPQRIRALHQGTKLGGAHALIQRLLIDHPDSCPVVALGEVEWRWHVRPLAAHAVAVGRLCIVPTPHERAELVLTQADLALLTRCG